MSDVISRPHMDGSKLVIERVQDVEPILERNKALQNAGKQTGDFRHIGTIPNVLIEKWINESGSNVLRMSKDEFARFIRRKLNDPDYLWLRTGK